MKSGWTAVAVAASLALAGPVLADGAKPRDGGGGGSSSSGASDRHPSSGGSSRDDGGSSSSFESGGSSGRSRPPTTDAQRRQPRPGTGSGHRGFHGGFGGGYSGGYGNYGGYYRSYSPWFYDPFYYGYYGYSPWYQGGYWGYSSSRYRYGSGYGYRDSGAVRVIADPESTRVYVDGYYAGIADDFDGIFQRLYLPPGRHDISLKLDGHQTHKFRVYVPVDQTLKIHHVMARGTGETEDIVGSPYDEEDARDRSGRDDRRVRDDRYGRDERSGRDPRDDRYGRDERRTERDADDDEVEDERDNADAGTIRLDIRPPDASVYVDGAFRGSGRQAERLRVAPGRHKVEVVRPGYRTLEREVEVGAGEVKALEVELVKN